MNKKHLYPILATAFLALVAIVFFFPDDIEGRSLVQHDMMQGLANGQEAKAYFEETGETTRWTDSLFGGMPNFQIAPSYKANSLIGWIGGAFMLWLPSPAGLLFAMMFGFFIMGLCMKLRWPEALFGAIAWGFSSYFIIIIGAGHIWKFVTLAYIPPTIGGLALLYRRKYLAGTALTALFGALQLQSNHPQMTYYFLFVVLALLIAWLVVAIRKKALRQWLVALGCTLGAGLLAVGANSASLYNTYEYSKETVRGRATFLSDPNAPDRPAGMDRNAITAWSYGLDETFSLLLPNVKGGATIKPVAGENRLLSAAETDKAEELSLSPEERQFLYQFPQYFGDQPMTNGPVYVGAFVLLLALLALFIVPGPVKWALLAVSVLGIFMAWGHNFPAFTNFMIDSFPGYNKFRAVSSALVIVEFTIPLLAALAIRRLIRHREDIIRNPWPLYLIFGLGALTCLATWISPSIFGDGFSASETESLQQAGAFANPAYYNVIDGIRKSRLSLVSSDGLRSFLFIAMAFSLIWLWLKGTLRNATVFTCALSAVALLDLFAVDKRYVNSDNFAEPALAASIEMTPADEAILKDKSHYRVMDLDGMGSARSSYFHNTVGGYHAAKLTRYNDLLDHQIMKGNPGVINMLNVKYFMSGDQYELNPDANGPAWLVSRIDYVADDNQEMAALDSLDTRHAAVAAESFRPLLGTPSPLQPGDTISLVSYAPNRIKYASATSGEAVALFSEIFFPWGWKASVDGKPVEIARADYTLRALRLPAGRHEITFEFDPQSIKVTDSIGVASVVIIYLLCGGAIIVALLRFRRKRDPKTAD
ncbi:MAG: YfhO family protein [Bacteroides sp.]|nr:YfhO family protein [Bacteroides sp.]